MNEIDSLDLRQCFYKLGYKSYEFNSYNLKSENHIGDITLKRKGVTIKIEEMKGDTLETLLEKIRIQENKNAKE